ncbi:helix-turn-helix domain-containing protein [Micromonospora eburnea]|uniref:helix-turn-helix domain-containing protein n=1 Tax=Micromonospora eburnea TaxID=227316 RepID=UPI000AB2BE7C|nr:helix-turn-helix domain-containing protein [Micromonospora eburnea]
MLTVVRTADAPAAERREELHRLFAAEQTSVSAGIRRRRLDRCRRDLADPALSGLAVGTVGGRWGLPDSAHFSRLFRAAFGVPPSDYRRMSLNPVAASQALGARVRAPMVARGHTEGHESGPSGRRRHEDRPQ